MICFCGSLPVSVVGKSNDQYYYHVVCSVLQFSRMKFAVIFAMNFATSCGLHEFSKEIGLQNYLLISLIYNLVSISQNIKFFVESFIIFSSWEWYFIILVRFWEFITIIWIDWTGSSLSQPWI